MAPNLKVLSGFFILILVMSTIGSELNKIGDNNYNAEGNYQINKKESPT